jgi:hypothetical protein
MGRPKKESDSSEQSIVEPEIQASEPEVQTTEPEIQITEPVTRPPGKSALVEKRDVGASGNYILRLDGLVTQVQKELEKVAAGDIPVRVVSEPADIRVFGKQTYLFFMEKSSNPNSKIILIDAVGLEDLSRKVSDIYGTCKLVDIISQPVNKRPQSKKVYLAIFVGE